MGGIGSTRWDGHPKKDTAEDALTLSVRTLKATLKGDTAETGWVGWTWGTESEPHASIGYAFHPEPTPGVLRLRYVQHRGTEREESFDYPVPLDRTRPHFGGFRVWLRCPLVRAGRPCLRRCGKLYLPPGARYFGCRTCYDLTYTSSQEAHQFDGLFRRVAAYTGQSEEAVRHALTEGYALTDLLPSL